MAEKKKSKSLQWFEETVVNDVEHMLRIGKIAQKLVETRLDIGMPTPEFAIAMYAKIFEAITDVVIKRSTGLNEDETGWSSFHVEIANRLIVGYSNIIDDHEHLGNFMVFVKHVDHLTREDLSEDIIKDGEELTSETICSQWNALNIKTQADVIKEIAEAARLKIAEIMTISIASHEFIMPMFCTIHSAIIEYLRDIYEEQDKLTVADLYRIKLYRNEEGGEEIMFSPFITDKLKFKSNATSGGAE